MSGKRLRLPPALLALAILSFFAPRLPAFEKTGSVDGVEYTLICADWALQKEKINALIILSRPAASAGEKKAVRLALDFPVAAFQSAAKSGELEARLDVGPGETKRFAFKGLKALEETDPGRHPFKLSVSVGGGTPEISLFEVETIRGPLVPRGLLSILVPALLSLLAIPVFVVFLRRRGEPGGWRTVKEFEMEPPEDAWWGPEEAAAETAGEQTP